MSSSARRKGNTTQRKAIAYLEGQGWLVDKVEKTGKFCKEKDLFGLFDLICVMFGMVLFVQVKTNVPAPRKPLSNFCKKYNLCAWCMTWYDRTTQQAKSLRSNGRKPRTGWVFHHYCPDGRVIREDNRR